MSQAAISAEQMRQLSGFGMTNRADSYYYQPSNLKQIAEIIQLAAHINKKVVFRGSGRSYGDAPILSEAIAIDLTRFNKILDWNPTSGILECEGGVTIEQAWRHCLPDGWWMPVVSGTMYPTLGGALAMNIHGKNCYKAGPLADHVLELDILDGEGNLHTLKPNQEGFKAVIAGMGLLGPIVRVKLQMHEVASGDLTVRPISCKNWDDHFRAFEASQEFDYRVSWIDSFAVGKSQGRGLFHAARYNATRIAESLFADHQDLPDTLMGVIPKSVMWRFLKPLSNRGGMRLLNYLKHEASARMPQADHEQSLVAFSFLLDYVPNWRLAYSPGGLIQYQIFVPEAKAPETFQKLITLQQQEKLENFLTVMKRHRADDYLLSHAVDGYSLAMDFKVTGSNHERLRNLCHQMTEIGLEAGAKFYFAKDSMLRPQDVQAYLGEEALAKFRELRAKYDPKSIFSNALAERVGL